MKDKKIENEQKTELTLGDTEEEVLDKGALSLSEEIKRLQEKNFELSQEILASTLYIKRYIRYKRIFAAIKWGLIILIIIFGFLSFNFVFDYLRETIGVYQDQVNQMVEQTNNVIR